ncbi:DUF2490 domain-containing protein [Pedobacter sp.]|uniref:DUF2490 domain-containing protein n=1 Tax=Pedobacter sp. TaxID=1411316 RepID=UPI003BA89309
MFSSRCHFNIKWIYVFIAIFCLQQEIALGQSHANEYWLFWTHTQKINERFGLLLDAQTRSQQSLKQLNTLLLRGAIAYNFKNKSSFALGYAYKSDFEDNKRTEYEHRIFQQYLRDFKIKKVEVQIRGRLEQRFLTEVATNFALRARGFVSLQIPVLANEDFSSGLFTGIQNELFLNVLNKQNVNDHIFDQNRPYISLGYRFSKKIETAFDYGLMTSQDYNQKEVSSVFRISLTSDF